MARGDVCIYLTTHDFVERRLFICISTFFYISRMVDLVMMRVLARMSDIKSTFLNIRAW